MGIIAWIVIGLLAGIVAKALLPGRDPGGIIITILIGIAGALLGGWLGKVLFRCRFHRRVLRGVNMGRRDRRFDDPAARLPDGLRWRPAALSPPSVTGTNTSRSRSGP
ncbi:hypothetical protein GCM10020254_74180 [Streptomyces goshikiensis]